MAQQRGQDQGPNGKRGDTSHRGFASMDPERQRAIAAEGGRAAHAQGVAHEFDSEEARLAGRKGGQSRASGGNDSSSISGSDRDMQGADRAGRGSKRASGSRERDSQGRFTDDDSGAGTRNAAGDSGSGSTSKPAADDRERDSQGRFADAGNNSDRTRDRRNR